MSVAVGLVDKTGVYLGSDSIGCNDDQMETRRDTKVWLHGQFAVAFVGSFRLGQLLRYAMEWPRRSSRQDVFGFMVTGVAERMRMTLKTYGFEPKVPDGDDTIEAGGSVLVGYAGRLFRIEEDFSVAETHVGFDAIGAGGIAALGALWQQEATAAECRRLKRPEPDSKSRIIDALTAAHRVVPKTAKPLVVVRLEGRR